MNIKYSKFHNILQIGLSFSRNIKRCLQMTLDGLAIFISITSAMALRLETLNFFSQTELFLTYLIILFPTIFIFAKMGLYRAFLRYVSTEIAVLVALGSFLSCLFVILSKLTIAPFIPWSIPIIYSTLLFISITGSRFILRSILRAYTQKNRKYIAIYGAGVAGAQLMQSLVTSTEYQVQMIIDDNPKICGQNFYGLRVTSFEEASNNFDAMEVDIILLAMPSASFAARQNIIAKINKHSLKVKTIPAVDNLIDGSALITEFKDIAIEDLLGREPVDPIPELLSKNISGKTVLVTGAGGSIGSELCRQIINLYPKKLLILDISELGIYNISSELEQQAKKIDVQIFNLIGSVQDQNFIASIFNKYNIQTIFHAAAYKHVPLMELNPLQAIKNNSMGTLILAKEAVIAKVTNFTLISTDKAVNPTNIMGASKRLAERICQAMNIEQKFTKFSIVRFGNVLGSSGSVVPLFKKQIASGGPITLTHPEVTRYFMTVGEAVQLVIQSSSLVNEGKLFVLDMGSPIKIKDLAFKIIQLTGLRPYLDSDQAKVKGDILVRVTGLRPGEKLFEELSYGKNLSGTSHPRIITVNEMPIKLKDMRILIKRLIKLSKEENLDELIKYLIQIADYTPNDLKASEKFKLKSFRKQKTYEANVIPLSLIKNKKK